MPQYQGPGSKHQVNKSVSDGRRAKMLSEMWPPPGEHKTGNGVKDEDDKRHKNANLSPKY